MSEIPTYPNEIEDRDRDAANARLVAAMHAWAAEMEAAPPGSATAFAAAELARRMAGAYSPVALPPPTKPVTVAARLESLGTMEVEHPEGGRYRIRVTSRCLLQQQWRPEKNDWTIWWEADKSLLDLPILNGDPSLAAPPELAPQPPPANPPRGEPVWPLVIAEAEAGGEDPRLVALMRARHAQGIAKYGVPLCTNDGRNTAMDALQEALDLVAYQRKRAQERGVGDYWTSGALDAARIARWLLDDIEASR